MQFLDTATLELVTFPSRPAAEYTVLSYTYDDVGNLNSGTPATESSHYRACILQACRQALDHDISFLWIDSICVNRSSSAEVDESVTASFRLLWEASLCIVYLWDMVPPTKGADYGPDLEDALPLPLLHPRMDIAGAHRGSTSQAVRPKLEPPGRQVLRVAALVARDLVSCIARRRGGTCRPAGTVRPLAGPSIVMGRLSGS